MTQRSLFQPPSPHRTPPRTNPGSPHSPLFCSLPKSRRRGLQQHVSACRSFQTGYFVQRVHSVCDIAHAIRPRGAPSRAQPGAGGGKQAFRSYQPWPGIGEQRRKPLTEALRSPNTSCCSTNVNKSPSHSLFILYGLFPLIKAGICLFTTAKKNKN